jgi:hypothetical protein
LRYLYSKFSCAHDSSINNKVLLLPILYWFSSFFQARYSVRLWSFYPHPGAHQSSH